MLSTFRKRADGLKVHNEVYFLLFVSFACFNMANVDVVLYNFYIFVMGFIFFAFSKGRRKEGKGENLELKRK